MVELLEAQRAFERRTEISQRSQERQAKDSGNQVWVEEQKNVKKEAFCLSRGLSLEETGQSGGQQETNTQKDREHLDQRGFELLSVTGSLFSVVTLTFSQLLGCRL